LAKNARESLPKKKRQGERHVVLLGAHFSIAGGLHKAVFTASEYECNALQLFTKNATTWKERTLSHQEVERFSEARELTGIKSVCSHTAYLINLASPERSKYDRSMRALEYELVRSSLLGIQYVIMHPGSHMGSGEKKGLLRIAEAINTIFDRLPDVTCRLLLETTSGQGSSLGHTFEQLGHILDSVEANERIGFCFDTCHVFAAGYDLRGKKVYQRTMKAFDSIIGLDHLCAIHLNDAKKELASRVDRHEHIGEGAIGIDAFRFIMNDQRLKTVPKILETPKRKGLIDYDLVNLKRLRSLVSG
jgi:deoxyribonuclease-4